jgi:biotin carboxyl carrier protein
MDMQKKRVRVLLEGKEYLVEVDDLDAHPITARVEGQTFQVYLDEPTAGAEVPSGGRAKPVLTPVSAKPAATPIPESVTVTEETNEVRAPMPGDIIEVLVKPGDSVRVGQELCYLDAMKMKNAIRSPREGVIASVEVQAGEDVDYGQVLVTFQ